MRDRLLKIRHHFWGFKGPRRRKPFPPPPWREDPVKCNIYKASLKTGREEVPIHTLSISHPIFITTGTPVHSNWHQCRMHDRPLVTAHHCNTVFAPTLAEILQTDGMMQPQRTCSQSLGRTLPFPCSARGRLLQPLIPTRIECQRPAGSRASGPFPGRCQLAQAQETPSPVAGRGSIKRLRLHSLGLCGSDRGLIGVFHCPFVYPWVVDRPLTPL